MQHASPMTGILENIRQRAGLYAALLILLPTLLRLRHQWQ